MRNPGLFTTGMIAKLCGVAPRTVSKWIDSGRLKGRRLPGSMDRRVGRAELDAFLARHGISTAIYRLKLGDLADEGPSK
jgi:two-component system, OmpR family, response regulator RpaA